MKGIYKYTDLETSDVVYVGKDSHIDKNKRHKSHLSPHMYNNQPFNRILQNNPDRYEYTVVYASDFDDDLLNVLEINTIAEEKPKFNFTKGGDGLTGYKHTDESKQKISKVHKGKTISDETKHKMSESRNTSSYFRVSKHKDKTCKQGFIWRYVYLDEKGKIKEIVSVDIKKLESKVKAKGLEWRKLK